MNTTKITCDKCNKELSLIQCSWCINPQDQIIEECTCSRNATA